MSLDFASEIYEALRYHIDFNDQKEAADTLINLLIDHDYEPEDIKESFRGNKEVLTALKDYLVEHDLGEDEDEDEEDEDDDEWD
jgi:hypothetical protein